jgi:L-asparaginase II
MLRDIGLVEGDLACGPHEPLSPRGARVARESGNRLPRLHNNWSGKHAAMLARAPTAGWPTTGYERQQHPVQRDVLDTVAAWTGVDSHAIRTAVDGCGVPVFELPLESMARSYSRLAVAARRGDDVPRRVVDAMRTRPFLVGGTERFDSVLMEHTDGRVIAKVGAEGVHSLAMLDECLGVALKVEDGAQRAQYPAVLRLLQQLGALPAQLAPPLAEFLRRPVRNTRGEVVGEVLPAC